MYSSAMKHVYARQLSSGEHAARILHNTSTSGSEVLQGGSGDGGSDTGAEGRSEGKGPQGVRTLSWRNSSLRRG